MRVESIWLSILACALVVMTTCAPPPARSRLQVTIASPADGARVVEGETVHVVSTTVAEAGVERVELWVDGALMRADAPPAGAPEVFTIAQPWAPAWPGQATLSVVAYDALGAVAQAAPVAVLVASPPDAPSPAAPGDLDISFLADGTVVLSWVDHAADEEGFHVLVDGVVYATLGPGSRAWGFAQADHFCGQTVELAVVAYRGGAWSAPSAAVDYAGPPCAPGVVVQAVDSILPLPTYLDLDTGGLGDYETGVDLLWHNAGGLRVAAVNGTRLVYLGTGAGLPDYTACAARLPYDETALYVPPLQPGAQLCWQTTAGHVSAIVVREVRTDGALALSYSTWRAP